MYGKTECQYEFCDEVFEKNSHNQRYHDLSCKRNQENYKRRQMVSDIAAAVAPSYADTEDMDDDEIEQQLDYLRRENKRLGRAADKYKSHRLETINAIQNAAFAAFSKMDIAPVSPPKLGGNKGSEEVANPWWGDWQCGKVTPTYDSDVCEERIELLMDKTIRLTSIQREDHDVNHARIYVLGDMVEGEDIFPGQHWYIDSGIVDQVMNVTNMMIDSIRRMLSYFETVHLVGVEGNHGHVGGRNNRYYHPDTNLDRLLYKFVEKFFENEKRITFDIPQGKGEANYYTVDSVGDHSTLLLHGDQFTKPTSAHAYIKKVTGWRAGAIPEFFNDVAMGHWHQNTKMTIGDCVLRINGTPESTNLFAQKVVSSMGRPSQHLQFIHPENGVTAEYDIYLD